MQLHTWKELGELKGLSISVKIHRAAAGFAIALIVVFLSTPTSNRIQEVRHHDFQTDNVLRFHGTFDQYLRGGLSRIDPRMGTDAHICRLVLTLNARKDIRAMTDDPEDLAFSLHTLSKGPHNMSSKTRSTISIKIETHETVEAQRHLE
ncbi:hypothetical protein K438DRAFT_1846228, partial [Mycena galopus ATCC 62051]